MRGTVRIGRIAGVQVQVQVHWSVLLIFALIAWSLSTATFPSQYPRSRGELLVAALGAAVVFLLGLPSLAPPRGADSPVRPVSWR